MDKSIVAIEQSHSKANSVASTSKSFGLVKINSIAIDLNSSVEETEAPDVHEHFSIRGFVAGMRKKDISKCYPFTTPESGGANLEENLPPLNVPNFRWWQCSHCVPESSVERGALAMVVAERGDANNASPSENVNGGNDGLSLLKDIVNFAGNRHGSRDLVVRSDHDPSNAITNLRICGTERQKATTCSKDKADSQNSFPGTSRTNPFQNNKRNNNSADASDMLTIAERPFSKVNNPENASSASDGTLNALPRRRKPKLRSLADIIMEERKQPTTENRRPISASSSGVQTTSTDSELPSQIPSEIAKGTEIPQAKRKFVFEEETGTQGKIYQSGLLKRFKGQLLEAESTSRMVESSNLEPRRDELGIMTLEHWSKSPLTNVKKRKAIDNGKKMGEKQIGNGKVAIKDFPKVSSTCSGNLKKHDASIGSGFSRPRGMAPYFKSSLSGQEMEKMPSLSKSKRAADNEVNGNNLIPSRKSNVGDLNDKGKAALDNSFASYERNPSSKADRGIPDLNETFTHNNTAVMRGKQLPTLSENVLPVNKNLDISASCSKATIKEGKRPVSDQQTLQNMNNNMERGSSEDITMEIVELLAKNKLERKLENSRKHLWPDHGINNNSITPPNARFLDPHPIPPNFPALLNRNGQTVAIVNNRVDKTHPLNFPHPNKPQLDMGKLENSRFSLFGPFTASQSFSQQKKTPYSSSSSKIPAPGGGPDPLWSPRQVNVPFHLTVPQNHNHPFQVNSTILPSFSNGSHKGKTVSDIKGREEKRTIERQNWPNPASVGGLDPYLNDAIPAMQLLSLMDQRIASGSPLKMGPPKNFMNKTFTPCNNHPPVNRNENQNVFNGLQFSQNGHYKDLLESCYRVTPVAEKNTSSYFHRQMPHEQGNSKGVHMVGPSSIAIRKARAKSPLRLCTLNRNPADFSVPDEKNEFTISSKDLKLRKKSDVKGKSPSVNVSGQKQQRPRKVVPGKEYSSK